MLRRTMLSMSVLLLAAPAFAQEAKKDDPLSGFLVSPDRIFQEIAKGMARHYDLDEDQHERVRTMVAEYGRKFMIKNADELRSLQMEGMKFAILGGKPDPDTIRDLGKRVKALLSDARDPIEQFGNEFHEILNDDQKARHEIEHRQVKLLLEVADLELDKMIKTGALPGPDQSRGGRPGNDGGGSSGGRRFTGSGFMERQWEGYVKGFQTHYRFDDDQIRRSDEMLALAKKDAAEYRKANEEKIKEFSANYAKLKEAAADKTASIETKTKIQADRKALDAEADQFEAPLRDIFEKLKEALDLLPTEEQKTKYKAFPLRNAKKKG